MRTILAWVVLALVLLAAGVALTKDGLRERALLWIDWQHSDAVSYIDGGLDS